MKRAVIVSLFLTLALCAWPSAFAQSADPNIEAITFTNGKSNLKEKVYDSKAPCMVFFWDSRKFKGDEGQRNEYEVFKALAKNYKGTEIRLFTYDVTLDKGYAYEVPISTRGEETRKENISIVPSVAMYNNGKQIDIRQGGTKTEYIKKSFEDADLWIRDAIYNEWPEATTKLRYNSSTKLAEVPR